ncbi:diguanylate cyclase (GGDEF)-like protein [Deinococcus metalli]|uniref:Diguanylate cyclase (GGDEF)-like protein n=1 Tax=Deinococcus metalli TaxID=1141878 RepID=A0A7W8KD65_9DEIO|nr:GGDEF domain-containing protein [Deinococcus metalli]MBB5374888.1 diguanylate cyclase (GGDEF)-like protein [Deinococcus metalli]GHF32969.1 GGDEF domain-containing protein [Deinococcus metalli]
MPSTPTTPHDVPQAAAWQRSQERMFSALVGLTLVASAAALALQRPHYDRLDVWALPGLALLLLTLQGLLWTRRLELPTAMRVAYVGGAAYVLLALNHQFSVLSQTSVTLMESTYWFAVIYAAAFLAFPSRAATAVTGGVLGLAALICAWHVGFTVPAATRVGLTSASVQFLLTGAVLIVLNRTIGVQHHRLMASRAAAFTDVLTGLANRRAAEERLADLAARAEAFTLVLFDLDHFKAVNDTHGHATGDAVLRGVGASVRSRLPVGGLAARWGGEEFLLVLPPTPPADVQGMLDMLRASLHAQEHGPVRGITACFGVASARPGEHPDHVLARADRAMYAAKAQGRNDVQLSEGAPRSSPLCPQD